MNRRDGGIEQHTPNVIKSVCGILMLLSHGSLSGDDFRSSKSNSRRDVTASQVISDHFHAFSAFMHKSNRAGMGTEVKADDGHLRIW